MDSTSKIVEELFQGAAELEPEQRADYLDRQCTDAAVRAKVDRLLELDASGAASSAEATLLNSLQLELSEPEIQRIGQYTIVRRIGQGGMGAVFEATQEHPRRVVALKLVRRDLASPSILRRFRYEVDVLGQLHHPGIAQIYEAGIAELGGDDPLGGGRTYEQPFFAMELVRGELVTEYADRERLGTRARLELLAKICDAVQHAHLKGVIHRDLKPANILVTENGAPKILDFGVARAADPNERAASLNTATGQLIGTLPYMSPEQVSDDPASLDTRSDVYALGVILYELLTGHLPHDLRDRSIPEAALTIRDALPKQLSTFDTSFRGDVETLVAKALEKDRERRYASASELAADIRRYLDGKPIQARPATTLYQLRKFTTRHPALVGGLVATSLALLLGIVATSRQAYRATRAEADMRAERGVALESARRASQSLQRTEDIHSFLLWGFGLSTSDDPADGSLTILEMLDHASASMEEFYAGRPEQEAAARRVIGTAWFQLGQYERAVPEYTRACELLRGRPGMERVLHVDLLMLNMAERESEHGEAAAQRWIGEAMELELRILGERYPELAQEVSEMAASLLVPTLPREFEIRARLADVVGALATAMPADHPDAVYVSTFLILVATYVGNSFQPTEACQSLMNSALAILRDVIPADPRRASFPQIRLLKVYLWMIAATPAPEGEEELRVELARELTELSRWSRSAPWFSADVPGVLGDALLKRGRAEDAEEAERLVLESRARLERTSGDRHIRSIIALERVVRMYQRLGRQADLDRTFERALSDLRAGLDPQDDSRAAFGANALCHLSRLVAREAGLAPEAYELAQAGAARAAELEPGQWRYLNTEGIALQRAGRSTRALEALRSSQDLRGEEPSTWAFIAMAHEALGQHDQALAALTQLRGLPVFADGALTAEDQAFLREAELAVEAP